ncbi:MAG: hypothetical protein HKN23_03380 [Verrucomicrobiales bacterium]|nr:hypothetical protein [Verrucomicrobiales bacterium]
MRCPNRFLQIVSIFCLSLLVSPSTGVAADFTAPVESTDEFRHFLVQLPAPRGLILDRRGEPLATNRAAVRLAIRMKALDSGDVSSPAPIAEFRRLEGEIRAIIPNLIRIPDAELVDHWKNRPFFPVSISEALQPGETEELRAAGLGPEENPAVEFQSFVSRDYPAGPAFAHITGYVGRVFPEQRGQIGKEEFRWCPVEGRTGLEKSMDRELRGENGLLSLLYDEHGREVNREILKVPVPGRTVVTSIHLDMQKLAYDQLEQCEHDGAFVAMDSENGDILAAATYPSYDASEFLPSISPTRYRELKTMEGDPFFNRAISGEYPPGSTFKPIVALAALSKFSINSTTRFSGPPSIWVDGREFKNWNEKHEGTMDVKYALLRSCNTWFYQAGFQTGSEAILRAADKFSIGIAPNIPLEAVATGNAPEKAPSRRGIANLAIGQGALLASPVQMAAAMTVFANSGHYAHPRLVLQVQDPIDHRLVKTIAPNVERMTFLPSDIETVREGMWGVVNYGRGTGQRAKLEKPHVFGKTGTAQWSTGGNERRLAWFTGFADAENPKIAFAVLTEGREDEKMSGGRNSAPLAGEFLRTIYEGAADFEVEVPEQLLTSVPSLSRPRGNHDSFDDYYDYGTASRSARSRDSGIGRVEIDYRRVMPRKKPPSSGRKRGLLSRIFGN